MLPQRLCRLIAYVVLLTALSLPAQAETPVGSNVDSRVMLGLTVNADAMQAMMPEGWQAISWPGGP